MIPVKHFKLLAKCDHFFAKLPKYRSSPLPIQKNDIWSLFRPLGFLEEKNRQANLPEGHVQAIGQKEYLAKKLLLFI